MIRFGIIAVADELMRYTCEPVTQFDFTKTNLVPTQDQPTPLDLSTTFPGRFSSRMPQTFGCCRSPINLALTVSGSRPHVKTSWSREGSLFGASGNTYELMTQATEYGLWAPASILNHAPPNVT